MAGRVEMLSSVCATGWIELAQGHPSYVAATLGDEVLGVARADLKRPDLTKLASEGTLQARAFAIVFEREVRLEHVLDVEVRGIGMAAALPRSAKLVRDRHPRLQVFVLGSPRSGTSELGDTLATQLGLPWLGEGHAAPHFAAAAAALAGDGGSANGLVQFMAQQDYHGVPARLLKCAYYFMHSSASFLDKTPGIPMIKAAPYVAECFPDAKFIYLRRNGISNVLSRLRKFGGSFSAHCLDWAGAMQEWTATRDRLPDFLELQQEEMLRDPEEVAERIGRYLGETGAAAAICASLRLGSRERTGAGIGRATLEETGWSTQECETFLRLCGPTMRMFGYDTSSAPPGRLRVDAEMKT